MSTKNTAAECRAITAEAQSPVGYSDKLCPDCRSGYHAPCGRSTGDERRKPEAMPQPPETLPSLEVIKERIEAQRTAIFDMTSIIHSVQLALDHHDDGCYEARALRLAMQMSAEITEELELVMDTEEAQS